MTNTNEQGMTAGAGGVLQPVSNPYKLPDEAAAYLNELAAEIVGNGNPHGDLIAEAEAAHERRQAFASEMHKNASDRAKKARAVIAAHVYGRVIARDAIRRTFDNMEDAERRAFVLAQAVEL